MSTKNNQRMKADKHSSNKHCSGICCIPVTCTWMLGVNSAYFQVRVVDSVKKFFEHGWNLHLGDMIA